MVYIGYLEMMLRIQSRAVAGGSKGTPDQRKGTMRGFFFGSLIGVPFECPLVGAVSLGGPALRLGFLAATADRR